jgi:hypothetical protein
VGEFFAVAALEAAPSVFEDDQAGLVGAYDDIERDVSRTHLVHAGALAVADFAGAVLAAVVRGRSPQLKAQTSGMLRNPGMDSEVIPQEVRQLVDSSERMIAESMGICERIRKITKETKQAREFLLRAKEATTLSDP